MEINHLLKDVISLNEYISATHDVLNKYKNLKVTINIATVLTLKKIRSLEIEYLNKCEENGVACTLFERLLATPPSKIWGVLAKELVYLIQYWLEAIRKHLIYHSNHWWMFLKKILNFIKELRLKDPAIPNMLVELTGECLFDLATAPKPDVFQRHEILHCLNMVCAESGREIRFAMRIKFGDYFVKLASLMATSGYLPCQYSSLECLLRWLVPRQERSLRSAAADKWFPPDLFPVAARNLFLNSTWMNFFQDARDFLNALNEGNGLITSVICRRLTIGEVVLINGTERQQTWLDFNTSSKSISVLLDPKVLEVFGVAEHRACETLHIDEDITEMALLRRESLGLTISLNTLRAPYIRPTDISTGDRCLVNIGISSQANLRSLDEAMRSTFGGKYQLLLDLDIDMTQSPQRSYNKNKKENTSEEDTRFSHPVAVKRRKHSGYIVRNQNTGRSISPSTASTSSLIQLKDRLAALPRYKFDKEPVSVCAQPALSNVTELTEQDDRSIYTATTNKFQPYGVCYKSLRTPNDQKTSAEKKHRSEGETVKKKSRGGRGVLSPVVSDDNSTSLLLVATVGSTNDSVINETIERLSKSKEFDDDNIVNLLVQEALQGNTKSREVSDSGINTDEKKSQEEIEAIDDTPKDIKDVRSRLFKKNCTIVSKLTTDDESNTEAINETPAFVSTRKNIRSFSKTTVKAEKQTYHVNAVEEFFSQHITENERGRIVISPTLAKKINETSSETSENFDDNCLLMNEDVNTDIEQGIFNDIAAMDCLNDMVDKVCSDLDKCTKYKGNVVAGSNDTVNEDETSINKDKSYQTPISKPLEIQKPKRILKLKYKPVKKTKARATKKTKNVEQETTKKMSIILEQKEDDTFLEEIKTKNNNDKLDEKKQSPDKKTETSPVMNTVTPLVRRKRKLYSPKDDDVEKEIQALTIEKTSDDFPLSELKILKNTKTTASCYKELEKERKKYTRLPRSRRSKAKVIDMPSPRTLKINSMFDNLKQTVESEETITLVDKTTDVYNFTSDSDDDDFQKKMDLKKCFSATVESAKVKKSRNSRRGKESESSYEESKAKTVKRKKVTKRTVKRNPEAKVPVIDLVDVGLVDERMREAVREELNTSIIIEHSKNLEPIEIEPTFKKVPQMEEIYDSLSNDTLTSKKNAKKTLTERVNDSESNDTSAPNKRAYKRTKMTQVEHDDKSNDFASKKSVKKRGNKKTELLLIKKEKELAIKDKKNIESIIEDEGTISPLPGLVVESIPKYKEEVNDSLTTNMLQKFKRIYKDGPDVINDSVNTQNMLSDVERFNLSAQNYVSIADEMYFEDSNKENVYKKTERDKCRKHQKAVLPKTTNDSRKKITTEKENEIIETIDIHDVNDDQLDKSIASDDINAHGDVDELPPNPETIKEVLQPREIQDLDQSMKDYFTKLTREIHNSTSKDRDSSKSAEGEEIGAISRNKTEKSVISPIISVKRLAFEDISRWMPSRRTSDTTSHTSSKIRSQAKHEHSSNARSHTEDVESTPKSTVSTRKPQGTSTPESNKSKSPIVQIARMSFDEFEKWLPLPKSLATDNNATSLHKDKAEKLKLVYRTRSKSKINTTEIITTKNNAKDIKDVKKTAKENAINSNVTNTRKRNALMRKYEASKLNETSDSNSDLFVDSDESTNKSCVQIKKRKPKTDERDSDGTLTKIKPVGKELMSTNKQKEDNVSNIDNSSDDECLERIRSVFSKHNDTRKYSLRNASKSNIESLIQPLKRKSSSPILSERRCVAPKSRKRMIEVLEDVILTESLPSVSSVNDWFRRTEPIGNRGDNASMICKDTMQSIMEKLDTTLVESNQNTSKKFVNLFVEAHKNLRDLKEEKRRADKHVGTELIGEIIRLVDEKFADSNRKWQAMLNDFMENLKKQAFDLIRDDCKQKRAMILLLKEDVQAVMDYINSKTTDSS